MPFLVLQAAFLLAWEIALSQPDLAMYFIPLAVVMRLGWFALLRVGEAVRLHAGDLRLPRLNSVARCLVLAIKDPKNKHALGRAQYTVVADEGTISWVRWLAEGLDAWMRECAKGE